MKNLPRIVIKEDKEREIELFIKFLNHPDFPQHRNLILKAFPDLKIFLDKSENEKIAVKSFIKNFYKKRETDIQAILSESHSILRKKGQIALKRLANIMEYQWPKPITYIAMPTILPFSPFGTNIFYFSILRQIHNKEDKRNVLSIAIHEISHFIFFDLLKKIEKKNKFKLPKDSLYYLKESLTAALFNQKNLCNLFGFRDYVGNPEIRDIYIKTNGKEKIVKDFVQEIYIQKINKEKKSFKSFLNELTKIFISIAPTLSKKRSIWNRYGKTLLEKPKILAQYRNPIQIK